MIFRIFVVKNKKNRILGLFNILNAAFWGKKSSYYKAMLIIS